MNQDGPPDGGMIVSLRDWFAGQALTGIISKRGTADETLIAREAYTIADAMLKRRDP